MHLTHCTLADYSLKIFSLYLIAETKSEAEITFILERGVLKFVHLFAEILRLMGLECEILTYTKNFVLRFLRLFSPLD